MKKNNILSALGIVATVAAAIFDIAAAVFSEAGQEEEMRKEVKRCVHDEVNATFNGYLNRGGQK